MYEFVGHSQGTPTTWPKGDRDPEPKPEPPRLNFFSRTSPLVCVCRPGGAARGARGAYFVCCGWLWPYGWLLFATHREPICLRSTAGRVGITWNGSRTQVALLF